MSTNRVVIAKVPPLLRPQAHFPNQRTLIVRLMCILPDVFLSIYTFMSVHIEMCGLEGRHV